MLSFFVVSKTLSIFSLSPSVRALSFSSSVKSLRRFWYKPHMMFRSMGVISLDLNCSIIFFSFVCATNRE